MATLDCAEGGPAAAFSAALLDLQPGETWRALLDPAGHPFCLTDAKSWG